MFSRSQDVLTFCNSPKATTNHGTITPLSVARSSVSRSPKRLWFNTDDESQDPVVYLAGTKNGPQKDEKISRRRETREIWVSMFL